MKGLIWSEKNKMELVDLAEPEIEKEDDVKVEIYYSGICGTDLQVIKGKEKSKYGIVRGHEAVGTVIATGKNVKYIKMGDRVVIDPNQYCGECYECRRGRTNFCEGTKGELAIAGVNKNGTFAKYFVCSEKHIYKLPDTMSWQKGVMIEPLACVLNNFKAAEVKSSDSILIMGAGPMGLLCQMVGKKNGRLIVATEIDSYRLKFAEKIADYVFRPEELTLEKALQINGGKKFDVIIDTVGNQMEKAEMLIERGGRIVPMAVNPDYSYSISPTRYSVNGIKIVGAGEYNMLFPETIEIAEKMEHMESMVTSIKNIENFTTAIDEIIGFDTRSGEFKEIKSIKTVIKL